MGGLELTGERTLPGIAHERYWFARHLVAYQLAADLLDGRTAPDDLVLDAGCGEGYGSDLLARRTGARVLALDLDAATVAHVRASYPRAVGVRANLVALPLRARTTTAVVSLQTVEHLWDQAAFVAECAQVLRPGGLLVLSTPNRRTFSPDGARNPFHSRELDPTDLAELLATPDLGDVRLLGVHHGPRLLAFARSYGDPVAAQLASAPATWDDDLTALVTSVDPDDFEVAPDGPRHRLDAALDLVAVATRTA
jgi:SAM-dependent methyltransferase